MKLLSHQKLCYNDLWRTQWDLRKKAYERGIKKLAILKIGCRSTKLVVGAKLTEVVFRDTGVEILVCSWNAARSTPWRKMFDCHFFTNGVCTRGPQCRFRHAIQRLQSREEASQDPTRMKLLWDATDHLGTF